MEGIFAFSGCLIVGLIVVGVFLLLSSIKLLYEYERGVVFSLGKFSGLRQPGVTFILPIIQSMQKVDMRIKTVDIPRQEVMTRDN
ncbi:MAG: SPFH domain-containing protein, partial [Anaerolineales bacterium]